MNKYLNYIAFTLGLFLLANCQEEGIKTWEEKHHIYFEKFYKDANFGQEKADSTIASFFFLPEEERNLDVSLVVNITGTLLKKNQDFALKVVKDMTTAVAEEYTLAEAYTFRANNVSKEARNQSDTIKIQMHKTPRLKTLPNGVRLVLELEPLGALELGQEERRRAIIILNNDATRPKWWDKEVEETQLGKFSHRKYKLFNLHIDKKRIVNGDLFKKNISKFIQLVREFKKWLNQHPKEAVEEDGTPMTVQV